MDRKRLTEIAAATALLVVLSVCVGAGVYVRALNDRIAEAIERNDAPAVISMARKGASIREKDRSDGTTALGLLAWSGDTAGVNELLDRGADVNESDGANTPLLLAAWEGHHDTMRALLARGADVNSRETYFGWTALMTAARDGHNTTVKILLEHGADVNAVGKDGNTALMLARELSRTEIVRLLKRAGAKR